MKISLQICGYLENVEKLEAASPDIAWCVKVKCIGCDTVSPSWHKISATDDVNFKETAKGTVNFCMTCKFCRRAGYIDILKDSFDSYNEKDSLKFKSIVSFDCRAIEPVEYQFEGGWLVKVLDQTTVFDDVNLISNEWMDYDTKSQMPVGIYDLKYQFIRV